MGQRKKIKLEDIAEQLGVSIVTVSNALKDKNGVSDSLRKKIKDTADEMGYKTTVREKCANSESYMIGVLVAERYVKEFPSFYMEVYKKIVKEISKKGGFTALEVVTYEKENLEQDFLIPLDGKVQGLIIIGELQERYIRKIRETYKAPIVCVDYYDIYEDMDYIVTDSFAGMEQMTRLLLKQGYRDLRFVGTLNATKNITDRYLGFCKAMKRIGIEVNKEDIIQDRNFCGDDYHLQIKLPEEIPEAFVCNCDRTANLLIEKLKKKGIRVPEDVAVVGFDQYYSQMQDGMELTTYKNDINVLAHISVKTLLKRIEEKSKPEGVKVITGYMIKGNTIKYSRGF